MTAVTIDRAYVQERLGEKIKEVDVDKLFVEEGKDKQRFFIVASGQAEVISKGQSEKLIIPRSPARKEILSLLPKCGRKRMGFPLLPVNRSGTWLKKPIRR